ncbi:glycosyltransferase family 4 protein [Polaribacter sp. KT 15]|uniref:glycosyltransferase family 4 protein n=1 Tax=Polaribacter sp. KT 15 TaxID=1896175 RepID=UPI00090A2377|nr:glycosyltransferase family 4 protein [Polaribacter sp. KT 15]SHN09742.1 Glycosyltransferase involved in cell wall bisynthesis [Polaribacter sp. KT 15]
MGLKKASNIKVILISQIELPYSKIGSWSTIYDNYLRSEVSIVDTIICPRPVSFYNNISYSFFDFSNSFLTRIKNKLKIQSKWSSVFKALALTLNKNDQFIIKVIDNIGIIEPLNQFLIDKGLRNKCKILYFYHGHAPIIERNKGGFFFNKIDNLIFLTNLSYQSFKNYYLELSVECKVLHNGIDTSIFKTIGANNKTEIKRELNLENKKIFLWCSNDSPKKGLDFIIKIWNDVYPKYKNDIVLIVIGSNRNIEVEGVLNMGRIPNSKLSKYYQISDCYLFPTLCQEGFGMSLVEAKYSGCFCIASKIGGVPEVLEFGKYGNLIENPHIKESWTVAINEYLENKYINTPFPDELYSMQTWNINMNRILNDVKSSFI